MNWKYTLWRTFNIQVIGAERGIRDNYYIMESGPKRIKSEELQVAASEMEEQKRVVAHFCIPST